MISPDAATRAAWGAKPTGAPARPRMRLISWRPLAKGSLRGFATIELPIGLVIAEVPIFATSGRVWASLPSKPQVDKDGQHKRDVNGKLAYEAILRWRSRDLSDRFSSAVIALINEHHPGALAPDEDSERSTSASPRSRSPYARPRPAAAPNSSARLPDDSLDDLYADGER
jgi:hypothetical protein